MYEQQGEVRVFWFGAVKHTSRRFTNKKKGFNIWLNYFYQGVPVSGYVLEAEEALGERVEFVDSGVDAVHTLASL